MDISVEITGNTARVTLSGTFAIDRWKDAYDQTLTHPDFRPGMNTLWDFRGAVDIHLLSTQDLHAVAAEVVERVDKRGAGRSALVMNRDVDFGMARMYEMMMDGMTALTVRVFRDMHEAESWLEKVDA
jgi:hypothetical protein